MDLKIEDVADLLNVSESTIRRWLSDGKIPAYQLNEEYRFNRNEVEDWIVRNELETEKEFNILQDSDEHKHPSRGIKQYALFRAIHKGGVYHDVPGSNKEEIIRNSSEILCKQLGFDPDLMTDLLLDRENLMPTGLNHGIAIPHTREITFNTHYDAVAVVFPKEPIDFGALDNEPVHTLFFLFACDDKRHLNLLAKIAHLSRDSKMMDFLKKKPIKNDILSFLRSWEADIG
ncbi:MAG: Nitrogen regulatory protein [Chlamydiae bacterium]|nr:Nitrogen regulatory protein [Chlamydiota bacterium]